jgi:hypothetical protein
MKKQLPIEPFSQAAKSNDDYLLEATQHYQWWTDDNAQRASRDNGWDDITDAYWGKLPDDWPFISRTVDPRIRTALLEKNARLTNRSLKGRVDPREGGDVVKAKIHNAIISYQWDTANEGGTMNQKIGVCDIDGRMYQSKFAYVYWKTEKDGKKLIFDGNEMKPLNIRDCGLDPNCEHVRDAKWFQHRMWKEWEDIVANKDMFPGFSDLEKVMDKKRPAQKRRDTEWKHRIKELEGLEDRLGTDEAFPVVEIVFEYRRDKWIVFAPQYNILLGVLDNPYDHRRIPISQLRYYPIDGDNLGESEVGSVMELWIAIQAIVCAFLDEVILKMRPPLKVVEGAARVETLVYEPEAHWLMDNVNAVTEMESRADSVRYFQNTYPALVAAFNSAIGELSQGISNLDPTKADTTATEVKYHAKQQNTRDQKNQSELSEFVRDVVSMWISNNKQFLFRDPNKSEHILRIVGREAYDYFKRMGMGDMEVPPEASEMIGQTVGDLIDGGNEVNENDLAQMFEASQIPKFPIIENPGERNPNKLVIKPKLRESELEDNAELSVVPEDLDGSYDYVPDIKSMEAGSKEDMAFARNQAVALLTNPVIQQGLTTEGVRPILRGLLTDIFEESGLTDAGKYFQNIQGQPGQAIPGGVGGPGGLPPNQPNPGMAAPPQATPQQTAPQPMAQTGGLPNGPGLPQGLPA